MLLAFHLGLLLFATPELPGLPGLAADPELMGTNSSCLYFFLALDTASLNRTGSSLKELFMRGM